MLEVAVESHKEGEASKDFLGAATNVLQRHLTLLEQADDSFADELLTAQSQLKLPDDVAAHVDSLQAAHRLGREGLIGALRQKVASLSLS